MTNLKNHSKESYDWGLKISLILSSILVLIYFIYPTILVRCSVFNHNLLMKFEIFKFERVTSTNDVAINLIKEGTKRVWMCLCTKPKQRGEALAVEEWISDEGNLFVSIFFPLKNNYPPFNEFSIINPHNNFRCNQAFL